MTEKKLYKDRSNQILAGVCSGIAKYFNVDVTLVRLALIIACIAGFSGGIIYIIAALIMPEEPTITQLNDEDTY